MKKKIILPPWLAKVGLYLTVLGPGLITASAGNDAPGIATYSMVGSRYGYTFLWLLLLISVGMVVVNGIAARMGVVTGKGMADLIRERFGVKITAFSMLGLLIANIGSTVAEFAGVAAAGELFGVSRYITVPIAAISMAYLVLGGSYKRVEKILLILCLSALSYIVTVFIIKPDWHTTLDVSNLFTNFSDSNFILAILAVIGTTITPWGIFYLQASVADKGVDIKEFSLTRFDVSLGAIWANIVSAFIIITTAATLFPLGIQVETAEDAAMALAPLAGPAAEILFSLGLMGASLLAISVLPLSTTYAICEAFGFERGLNRSMKDAPIFYSIFIGIIIVSIFIVLLPGLPFFQLMFLSQSLNAILLPASLFLMIKLANDKVIMGKFVTKPLANVLAILLTIIISLVTVALVISPLIG